MTAPTDGYTFGWRWFRIHNDRLLSPLAPTRIELPRDGVLENAFFIPRAEKLWSMTRTLRAAEPSYEFAVTFGRVHGPFTDDPWMPRLGSVQSARYQTLIILTQSSANLAEAYDLPVMTGLDRHTLGSTLGYIEAARTDLAPANVRPVPAWR